MQVESEVSLSDKILALFKGRSQLNTVEITEFFPNENLTTVKSAIATLRGRYGNKKLRVKGYVNIIGRNGFEVPILELGSMPDVVKTIDTIEVDDEMLRRARELRAKREDFKHKREMAALDGY